jgi:hypothetical protein
VKINHTKKANDKENNFYFAFEPICLVFGIGKAAKYWGKSLCE